MGRVLLPTLFITTSPPAFAKGTVTLVPVDENEDGYYEALRADAVFSAPDGQLYVADGLIVGDEEKGACAPVLGREAFPTGHITTLHSIPTIREGDTVTAVVWFDGEDIWENLRECPHAVTIGFRPVDQDGAFLGAGGRVRVSMESQPVTRFGRLPARVLEAATIADAESFRVDVRLLVRRREPMAVQVRVDGPDGQVSAAGRFEAKPEPGEILLSIPLEFDPPDSDPSWLDAASTGVVELIQDWNLLDTIELGSADDQ